MKMILPNGVCLTYRFDTAGRPVGRTRTDPCGHTDTVRYFYDAAGRPIREKRNGLTVNETAYDAAGRRCSPDGGQTVTACRLSCRPVRTEEGEMLAAETGSGASLLFSRDGEHLLREREGPLLRTYRIAGTRVLSVRLSDCNEAYPFHFALTPVYRKEKATALLLRRYDIRCDRVIWPTALYRLVRDPLGDVVALTDARRRVVAEYDYDLFGRCRLLYDDSPDTVGHLNPFRFRGYRYHHPTGLYCCRGLCYDPETGAVFPDPVLSFRP